MFFTYPASRDSEGDSRGYRSAEEQARELARSIRREVAKLADKWNSLVDRSDAWGRCLDDAVQVSGSTSFLNVYFRERHLYCLFVTNLPIDLSAII